jgi:hypothetical protein
LLSQIGYGCTDPAHVAINLPAGWN